MCKVPLGCHRIIRGRHEAGEIRRVGLSSTKNLGTCSIEAMLWDKEKEKEGAEGKETKEHRWRLSRRGWSEMK